MRDRPADKWKGQDWLSSLKTKSMSDNRYYANPVSKRLQVATRVLLQCGFNAADTGMQILHAGCVGQA